MIANGMCGANRTVESKEGAMDAFHKLLKKYESRLQALESEVKDLRHDLASSDVSGGQKRRRNGSSKQTAEIDRLNRNPMAKPKLTLGGLTSAVPSSVDFKYLKIVVNMSLADAMIALIRDTYDSADSNSAVGVADASGESLDPGNLWFPILHRLGRKTFLVYSDQSEWKTATDVALRSLVDQLHLCIRNAFFLWREKNMDLMDALDSVGKEDFILTSKIVNYCTQSDSKAVLKEVRDWITLRTDKCVEFM
jgi:hypothetical protein